MVKTGRERRLGEKEVGWNDKDSGAWGLASSQSAGWLSDGQQVGLRCNNVDLQTAPSKEIGAIARAQLLLTDADFAAKQPTRTLTKGGAK